MEENYNFEDNEDNQLREISLNKKIFYIGVCLVIFTVMVFGLYYGKIIWPGKRKIGDIYFRGISLYILCVSGIFWVIHFVVQIIGSNYKDEKLNNLYYKRAYNYRILAIILLIVSFLIAFFSPNHGQTEIDPKYKKETIIYW